ncbi:transcription initiation factor IIE subunit beta [Pterulicium gracile]|uniref:Transcription initiation factor IIE subunit beta n=1 Tax=Pterulicium gracile TaxID=1884261 RepID=A0A5C3QEJ2_9AGAR|nr:transcription initiation factor IIE subunit beta [Pterula gracilis]
MSKLAKDAAAFKNVLHRQDYTSWHSQPPPAGASSSSSSAVVDDAPSAGSKKNKAKSNIVYSQPADTGTGKDVNTQLIYIINELKRSLNPRRIEDLAFESGVTSLLSDTSLLEKLKSHDRVNYDVKTGLCSYKHEFNFRNKVSLLTEIQRQSRKGHGIAVRTLKEVWKEAPTAIEELEAEGEVFVTRTQKDGQLKMVFWNEIKPNEEEGGLSIEQEFRDVWHSLKVPTDADLLKQLDNDGMQRTAAEANVSKAPTKKKGKKGGAPRQRQVRITNTHLKDTIDLSRDYVHPPK